MIPVIWWSANPDAPCSGYWDQALLRDLLDTLPEPVEHTELRHPDLPQFLDRAVVVAAGGANANHVPALNALLLGIQRAVLVITSDEERLFPHDQVIPHPDLVVWRQYGHADDPAEQRMFPIGYATGTREQLPQFDQVRGPWAFMGQVTHARRQELVRALTPEDGGLLLVTEGFAQGVPRDVYLTGMAAAKLAPCPAGHVHPDSFRFYEALEAGCVPVLDTYTSDGRDWSGWWRRLLGPRHPFILVGDWTEAWPLVEAAELREWPLGANLAGAWWEQRKELLRRELATAVGAEGGDQLTVLVSMSPIPSHPSLEVLEETLASVRAQLPDSLVLIMCDGVRIEQTDRCADYQEAVRQVVARCRRGDWGRAVPVVASDHQHQANMTRRALELVDTVAVVFVEHDTPLTGAIPWGQLVAAVTSGEAHVVRLHYDVAVHPDHRHLLLDTDERTGMPLVRMIMGELPALRTRQWSQRPHVARTDWYRMALRDHFPLSSRTMIEDKLHGVAQELDWDWSRLWLYAPEGNMQRSTHLDGRGADPKFPMVYE